MAENAQQVVPKKFYVPDKNHENGVEMTYNCPDEQWQWVSGVISRSSSYDRGWEATTVRGPPRNYPNYGDLRGAWAAATSSGTKEYLELSYDNEWFVTGVDIFETFNPGHVVKVSVQTGNFWVQLWSGKVAPPGQRPPYQSRIFSPKLTLLPLKTNAIRLDLDCTTAKSWAEIDCVLMRGVDTFSWSTDNHRLYPASFRKAAKTILLISKQKSFWTRDAALVIIKHTAVDWPWLESDVEERHGTECTMVEEAGTVADPEKLATLLELGFSADSGAAALVACDNNLDLSIDLLT